MKLGPEYFPIAVEATLVAAERMVTVFRDEQSSVQERNLEAARLLITSMCASEACGNALDLEQIISTALTEVGGNPDTAPAYAHEMAANRHCRERLIHVAGEHAEELTGIPSSRYNGQSYWSHTPWGLLRTTTTLGPKT